jgi:hypothetical protein
MVGKLEVVLGRHLLAGESGFSWEIPASHMKHRNAGRPHPDKSGGLNGSLQHELEVYLPESQNPKSFADVDLNAALLGRVLLENSQTGRFF